MELNHSKAFRSKWTFIQIQIPKLNFTFHPEDHSMVPVDELFYSVLVFFFISKVLLKLNQPLVWIGKMDGWASMRFFLLQSSLFSEGYRRWPRSKDYFVGQYVSMYVSLFLFLRNITGGHIS